MKKLFKLLCFAMLFSIIALESQAATGEVTKSGSTWTSKVDGSTVYTGSDMIDAINAACSGTGAGTVNVRNSGDAYAPDGLRSVNIQSNQTLDFHGTTMNCNNALNIYPVKGYKKSNVTVKNMNITGVPRYILHFSGCNGITLSNITAHTTRGSGIRIEDGSNLTMNGNINLHSPGHCIETMRFNDIYIGKVTVESPNGCGVLFNTSENCNIDEIWAYNCNPDGSYAGFRQANNNGTTHCNFLRAVNCGRGLYVITSSHGTTIEKVDIDDCNQSGISVESSAYNVRVNSGTISNTPKAIDLWDGYSDVCIQVNGGSYGDACGSSSGSYYSMTNRNSGLCLSSNNSNISQYSCNSSETAQHFELLNADDGYLLIKNRKSGNCLRSNGSTIYQTSCNSSYWSEMFSRQDVGSGYYLLKNRNTNTCLRIGNGSGDNVYLSECNSGYWSEMFSFSSQKSAQANEEVIAKVSEEVFSDNTNGYIIYPTTVENTLNVDFSNGLDRQTVLEIYSCTGKMMLSKNLTNEWNAIDATVLSSGLYILKISNGKEVITKKIIKK